jgi:hypothetical protein
LVGWAWAAYFIREPDARVSDFDAFLALGEHDPDKQHLERKAQEKDT